MTRMHLPISFCRFLAMQLLQFMVLLATLHSASAALPSSSSSKAESGNFLGSLQTAAKQPAFLPVEQAYQLSPSLQNRQLRLNWILADGYYLYRPKFVVNAAIDGTAINLALQFPQGISKHDEFFGDIEVYYQSVDIVADNLPASGTLQLTVTSQGCADAGLCYPPYTQYFNADLSSGTITTVDAASAINTHPAATKNSAASTSSITHTATKTSLGEWLLILGGAFIGGLILNLMPCVFPVLSLKVLAFLRDEQHSHALHGISYTSGVVASFVAIAALLLGLREAGSAIGWGFQLQSPWFVGLMVYLFFVLALNLSGVFEIGGNWTNSGSKLAQAPGYGGSFATGLLATLVASPCTAPFMGAALGFAINQPSLQALLVFACLGLGMATPVLAMSLSPALLKCLPKPGAWMEVFKQILAFPLYATALWLAWVLGNQTGANGFGAILFGCLLLAFTTTVWRRGTAGKILAAIAIVIALLLPFSSFIVESTAEENPSTPLANDTSDGLAHTWTAARLAQLRSEGKAVFVNVTADWCITCLANEKLVLSNAQIRQQFKDRNIIYLKADWTRYDANITRYLAEFGRNGVPLYVFYPVDNGKPVVLPQILRSDAILQIFNTPITTNPTQ